MCIVLSSAKAQGSALFGFVFSIVYSPYHTSITITFIYLGISCWAQELELTGDEELVVV
jgi:hypothetical protein